MFDELWTEIADAPGEIFDVIEYKEEWEKEEKFNVESYINSNYDYWWWKTIEFVLRPMTDVWPFGMRNPRQFVPVILSATVSTINSVV